MTKTFQIAIDGPVGAGKSTVAKIVADKLKIVYVDTGAMYRAVALYMKMQGIAWNNEKEVVKKLEEIKIELLAPAEEKIDGRNVTVMLNDEDVSWKIREPDMGEGASVVSQYQKVREMLVSIQRQLAANQPVIMEGRDIGTKVLPKAQIKIYMDARMEERARRKLAQAEVMGNKVTMEEAVNDVKTRDAREMGREIDPLRPAEGAWIFDTTVLSVEEVVDRIVKRVAEL
jgi:cytidylate kinase